MALALRLARRGLGSVWPNPAVGCVLVRDGEIVGRGWTQPGGRPHAEAEALRAAGALARGATAYVSLEPCAHEGQTPPCADALLAAGIGRAVIAVEDPDPRVSGRGIARLRAGGIEVLTPLCADAAVALNQGFFLKVREGRPLFTLKLAASLDGRIATASGESRWITGSPARDRGQWLRASHDAVLIGSATALADNPELTCRLPGLARATPVRIVLDRRLRLPLRSRLVATAREHPLWLLTTSAMADPAREQALLAAGAEVIRLADAADNIGSARAVAACLAARGLTRVLIEGGAQVAAVFLAAGLVDVIEWMQAPILIGGDGLPAVAPLALASLAAAPRYQSCAGRPIGCDWAITLRRPEGE